MPTNMMRLIASRVRRGVRRIRASTMASLYRIARSLFYATPLPPALRHRFLRRHHRYTAARRIAGMNAGGFFVPKGRGETVASRLPIPSDGRWSLKAFAEHHSTLKALAAGLSSPEEDGPLRESDIDIEPVAEGPLVTIIVRSYTGRELLLKSALESIAAQSYRPIEVVVAEDGPGKIAEVVAGFDGDENCRFRHVSTGVKAGRSAASNLGLAHAEGEFIGFLDDDDRLMEHHCGLLVARLLKCPWADAAYAACEEIEAHYDAAHGRVVGNGNGGVFFKPIASSAMLYSHNYFPIQAIFFRRSLLSHAEKFDKNLDALEDWLFWMRILLGRRIAPVAEITSRFYVPYGRAFAERRRHHINAEEYLGIQRTALWKFRGFTNMNLVYEHNNYMMSKALQRARLPAKAAGGCGGREPKLLEWALGEAPPRHCIGPKFDRKIVAFTSINLRYLPKALAWAESVKRHSPDWETHILINDAIPDTASRWPNVDAVYPICDLDIPSLHGWIFAHDVEELCTATKPFYAKRLLDSGYDYVFYMDPDTCIYRNLDILLDEMKGFNVLLTPHRTKEAIQDSEIHYSEMSILAHGVFNLGFIGFKQTPTAHQVTDFWKRRLLTHCRKDYSRGLFTDQKWLNLAPIYFDGIKICKHKGCNAAPWNISYRTITRENGQWLTGGEPLVFFHFSGYDRNVPRTIFDIFGEFNEDLERLIAEYDAAIKGFSSSHKEWKSEWIYQRYDNGKKVANKHREYYRNKYENMLVFPEPFYTEGDRSWFEYLKWLGDDHIAEATRFSPYF